MATIFTIKMAVIIYQTLTKCNHFDEDVFVSNKPSITS